MTEADDLVRSFLEEVGKKRGTVSFFDRFEPDKVISGRLRLHLDVIEVDRNRPTVVFMPGTNAYAILYGEYLTALADHGYNVVGFDPRGHGRSEGARGSYIMAELMADMRAAVRYARRRFGDPIVVSGSSQGGITAFYLAAENHPLAGAVCHNLADLGDPASVELTRFPLFSRAIKPALGLLARLFPELKVPMTLYIDLKAEPIRGLGDSRDLLSEGALLVPYIRLRGLASLGSEPLPCPVEEISTPVMIVNGEKDLIFPREYVERLFNRLTCKKRLRIYKGLHHYILFDNVETVIPDILQWLEEICG